MTFIDCSCYCFVREKKNTILYNKTVISRTWDKFSLLGEKKLNREKTNPHINNVNQGNANKSDDFQYTNLQYIFQR